MLKAIEERKRKRRKESSKDCGEWRRRRGAKALKWSTVLSCFVVIIFSQHAITLTLRLYKFESFVSQKCETGIVYCFVEREIFCFIFTLIFVCVFDRCLIAKLATMLIFFFVL